ncbi:RNA polymerase sigma factor SigJ [Arthrobacter sp. zg-Y820]|uniref:RNA polymerase sigma factor SigJ n=1 Tax=unclassified Arthrobacter TaxID=235627 RepID=UPI001E3EAC91|nr:MULTISPECIES: RNA polymerase sigma factor SigJ [unclassified Arthrobacter]MCC9198562.1 RNA polymerase sigma factor SigJ [Arthrobacter sp. zg-Y820]MDK1281432.1 RNA polymerase sigma factor SigJ [Arthrobacter sp. zg.Y820]MDK1361866.1 RNA polymerase sigma factor SigJ [Arthrobacter sp. zg-Y1219]WIB09874.1 RNA polymerase sigma factor SigJ [Arthrobacter sp. zg-Y820]
MAQGPEHNAGGRGGSDGLGGADLTRDANFLTHRGMVFTIAYDITGVVADAEDVVQETYLRWRAVPGPVENPRAYLARIAARQAMNLLRSAARRREEYPGEWLPEPLPTGPGAGAPGFTSDPETAALTAAEVSTAMLVVLQTLSGPERAAFVLHEVFGFGYPEIAEALDAGQPAVRQLVHRARERVRTGVPRTAPDAAEHRAVVGRFLEATLTGSVQALLDVLAPDVVLLSDGGGKANAALRPVHGPEKVARLMLGLASKYAAGAVPEFLELNGLPAVAFREEGTVTTVFQISLAGERVRGVYSMRNPDKLVHLQGPAVG